MRVSKHEGHRKSAIADLRTRYCRSQVNPRSVAALSFETGATRPPQDEGGTEIPTCRAVVFADRAAPRKPARLRETSGASMLRCNGRRGGEFDGDLGQVRPSAPNPKFAHTVRQMRSRTSGSRGALES